jgi:predicted lipoprotein with Yx(FWY)xxD motif
MSRLSSGSRRTLVGAALVGFGLTAAACTSSASPVASSNTTRPTAAPAGSTAGSSSATVSTGDAGSLGTVLTGPNGHTLYMLTTEHNGSIQCTGSCTSVWPPFTVSAGMSPKAASGLSGMVSTVTRPGGTTQVTYDGHPLYYYAPDTAVGEAKGQGAGGVWFALTSSGSKASSTASGGSKSTPTTSGGYGY